MIYSSTLDFFLQLSSLPSWAPFSSLEDPQFGPGEQDLIATRPLLAAKASVVLTPPPPHERYVKADLLGKKGSLQQARESSTQTGADTDCLPFAKHSESTCNGSVG